MIVSELSADTRTIADFAAGVPKGELVSFDQFSEALGRDVRQFRWILHSGLRVAERECGAVFAAVRGFGYRRLESDELMKVGQTSRQRIRRQARRGIKTMAAGVQHFNGHPAAVMRDILREQTALGLLEYLARDRNLPPIKEDATRPLPIAIAAAEFLAHITKTPVSTPPPPAPKSTTARAAPKRHNPFAKSVPQPGGSED